MRTLLTSIAVTASLVVLPTVALSSEVESLGLREAAGDPRAIFCLIVFVLSYLAVIGEEKIGLQKSVPVMAGSGIIWVLLASMAPEYNVGHDQIEAAIFQDLEEYGSLMLFLMAAMTYISALQGANVFNALRAWLIQKDYSYRQLFWITGVIAFFLSALADNMTTALVMGTVVIAVGVNDPRFVAVSMVSIVCAANAGGAFSPFGDITTLMVWQSGQLEFFEFFALFLPSVVSFLVPALMMSFVLPKGAPPKLEEQVSMMRGARRAIALGLLTITMAVSFEQFLGLPPFVGMMTGLSLLMFLAFYLRRTQREGEIEYDIFRAIKMVEWDTLLFFFGVMFSVGGLAFVGYLEIASRVMYGSWGPTTANVVMGAISALLDNIPIMFSVLSMQPDMSDFHWLLITLTCGIGGSLLSVGSAAGVALMGIARGRYTFMAHLKWSPVIALGYAAGIGTHFLVNG